MRLQRVRRDLVAKQQRRRSVRRRGEMGPTGPWGAGAGVMRELCGKADPSALMLSEVTVRQRSPGKLSSREAGLKPR